MQILLRMYDGKYYVWKEATFNNDEYIIEGMRIRKTNILAVKNANGERYARCRFCNTTMKNTPEDIERHFLEQEAKHDCLNCRYLQFQNKSDAKRVVTKNANGVYDVHETYVARLRCGNSFQDPDTERGKALCCYNQCRASGVMSIGGVLMDYPDLFAKQITVEALKAKKYAFCRRYDNFFVYDMCLRNTMWAYVNAYGVVDYFVASYRYNTVRFYYSATQKKLFHDDGGEYTEGRPYGWSDNKYNSVVKKIEALYKEGKAK